VCGSKLKQFQEAQTIITNTIICTQCGAAGHIAVDCKQKRSVPTSDGPICHLSLTGSLVCFVLVFLLSVLVFVQLLYSFILENKWWIWVQLCG